MANYKEDWFMEFSLSNQMIVSNIKSKICGNEYKKKCMLVDYTKHISSTVWTVLS